MSSLRVPRLALNRLPRIPSQKVLVLDSMRAARQRLFVLTLLGLLAAAGTLALAVHAARRGITGAAGHVLVIDAGSSGTRMYAYSWRQAGGGGAPRLEAVPSTAAPHKVPRRALPDKRAYQRVETEPGLDAFADDAAALQAKALGPLLEWAEAVVPRSQRPRTPVFLFGTAGLRKLSDEQQARLLDGCRTILGASPFRFDPSWVRIISGADEGVYGWIALNYLAGTLQSGGGSSGTVGALDLGGSSMEVTFAAEAVPWKEDAVNVTVLDATHQLYSHVHHHYGLNDAFDRAVTLLLARQQAGGGGSAQQQQQQLQQEQQGEAARTAANGGNAQEGTAAALEAANAGATGSNAAAEAAGSGAADRQAGAAGGRRTALQAPAVLLRRLQLTADEQQQQHALLAGRQLLEVTPEVEHPCLHSGYRKAYRRRQQEGAAVPDPPEVVLVGRPSYGACKQLAAEVVAADAPCSASPCALGTPQPSTAGHRFVALTGFFVVYKFFRLPATAAVAELEQAGEEFCGKSWVQVQAERPGELMLEDYCFRAPYIAHLLQDGLQLQDEQLRIGSGDMGWTLGAALAEGYRLGGLGQGSSSGGSGWGIYPLLVLLGAAASAWLLFLAALTWQQQRQWAPGSGRPGAALGFGLGLWGSLVRASWLPLPLRGLGSRLPFKGSGPNLIELSIDSGPPSSDRSSLSMSSSLATNRTLADLVPGGSPFPTARTLGGGWAPSHGPSDAAAGAAATAAGLPPSGSTAAGERPRGLSWAAPVGSVVQEGAAGGAGVGQDAAYATSRLVRSHPSRRSLTTSPEGDAQ